MASYSKITIVGNLGRKPSEPKATKNGSVMTDFSVAVSTKRGTDENTTWYNVRVFGKQAESCAQYLDKGRPVLVNGRHQIREYEDKDGLKRTSNEIAADDVVFLGTAAEGAAAKAAGGSPSVIDDSDLPF